MPLPAPSTVAAAPFTPLEEITPAHTPLHIHRFTQLLQQCCEVSA